MKQNFLIFLDFIKRLYKSRYILRMMALRELKTTYVGSFFGFFWAVINPLFQVIIYGIVFGIFFKSRPDPVYGTDSFFVFLLCSILPWQFFAQTVGSSAGVILANRGLIKRVVGFPSVVLPIVTVISNIISHFISLGLLILVLLVFTGKFSPFIPFVFIYLFFCSVFCVGLGWIFSGMNVFLKDIPQILGLVLMGWFFITPIFYSPGILSPQVLTVLKLNPMFHVVDGYRLALLGGGIIPSGGLLYLALISGLTFGLGAMFFRKMKPLFAEVL